LTMQKSCMQRLEIPVLAESYNMALWLRRANAVKR
jgi:hypothetical protein